MGWCLGTFLEDRFLYIGRDPVRGADTTGLTKKRKTLRIKMDSTSLLIWGVVFGAIGLGFFTYGKKQKAIVPLFTGIWIIR